MFTSPQTLVLRPHFLTKPNFKNMKLSKLIVALNMIAIIGAITLSGCGDDDSGDPTPTVTLTADAGVDQAVDLGNDVTLNGSGSSSSDGSSFEYLWAITSAPSGSAVTLSGETTVNPSFTPDVEGTYTVLLTITNGDTNSTDEVEVTVNQAAQAQEIGGVIDTDTTLPDIFTDPNTPDYIASTQIDLRAQLTIEPGVVIHFAENVVLDVESGSGVLIAEGSSTNGIVMTSANASGGILWKGIYIGSSSSLNVLDYVEVSYAGNSTHNFSGTDYKAAIGVESSGKVSVTNSTIINNSGYGLYADDGGGQIENFADNNFDNNETGVGVPADEADDMDGNTTFSNNTNADVEIFSTTYADTKTSTWQALNSGAAYRVSGNLQINGDLTIAPGAVLELDEDVQLRVEGTIIADGTDSDHITFTSSNVAGSIYWKGIFIISSTSQNSFNYVDLSYAGNSTMNFFGTDYAAGIGVQEGGKVSVNNSSITDNKDYGLYVDDGGGQIESFGNNHFENNIVGVGVPADEADDMDGNTTFTNNSGAAVEIFGTNLTDTKTVTWNDLNGTSAYRITGNMDVNGELTIAEGAIFEMDENVQITVNGAFIADATAASPITFTTSNVAGSVLWQGFFFLSSDSRNIFDNVVISFAGNSAHNFSGSDFKANIGINSGAVLTVTNSVISDGGGYGIYNIGTLTESGNTYTNNVSGNQL